MASRFVAGLDSKKWLNAVITSCFNARLTESGPKSDVVSSNSVIQFIYFNCNT